MINWNQFLLCLGGGYLLYFMFNILIDLLRSRSSGELNIGIQELYFSEDFKPMAAHLEELEESEVMGPEAFEEQTAEVIELLPSCGALECTGAVNLSELFAKAKDELIIYTGGIAY